MQQKFTRIEGSPERSQLHVPIENNHSLPSSMVTRPKTGQPSRMHTKPDETMKIYRVKPKLLSRQAFSAMKVQENVSNAVVNNFFQQSQAVLDKLDPSDKGPRFDEKGQILKYTLVGSVQQFNKEVKLRNMASPGVAKVSIRASHVEENLDCSHDTVKVPSKDKSHSSFKIHSPPAKKKKDINNPYNEQLMNTQDVNLEIKKCQLQVKAAKMKSEGQLKQTYYHLNKGDRLQITAFERQQQNYIKHINKWERDEERFSDALNKHPQDSLYRKSEQMRTHKEIKDLLEAITPEYEKFGDRAWQTGLRQPRSSIGQENPYEFVDSQQPFIDRKCPIIEIIRKPSSSQLKSRYEGRLPYTTYESGKLLEEKLNEHRPEVNKLIQCNQEEIHDLEIQGKNILNLEIQCVEQLAKQHGPYVRKVLKQETQEQLHRHPAQIVEVAWDKKLLLKTGKFALAKTSFFIN